MKRFDEQLINQSEAVKGAKPLRHKHPSNKPPELVDVGLNMLVKSHSLHGMGLEIPGSVALESAAHHSLAAGMQSTIEVSVQNEGAVEILKKEQADFERVNELLRQFENGEIGGKKNRSASEKKDKRRLATIH
ncbi:MAG: hypothetical protein A3J06_04360 [Candidatus Moranbacteria bacterium RIFCSPLOWO2_02_FULL_48_19]|nr:MAG: hypothetical protein A3J06_04360 [Candidatus Moranbacteria bacterium RIFCSPLOWO2_02_FULL_48_19]OGI31598.1 MAG: hypothetical protein A3G09_04285 [Candidatus Moranbacteria bacterium RIFCSPLOWO2_12_FULL_48_12]